MKIGLVMDCFDTRRGGTEWWTYQFADYLLRQGHEVHLVAQDFFFEAGDLAVVPHRLGKIRSPLRRAQAAADKLHTLKLDLIHDMGLGWYCDVFQPHIGCWTAIARQKLLWVSPWLRPIKRRIDPWLPRNREHQLLAARQTAAENQILLALSHKVALEYQQYHNVPPSRIRVVYNGVNVNKFSPQRRTEFRASMRRTLGIADHVVLALAVAHSFKRKGVPTLLRALEILAPKKLPLHAVIVGDKRFHPWQKMAKSRGLPVTFVGVQPDTVRYYAAADFLVHPTFYDNCSLVFLEAAASGLPLLATREDGATELLTSGVEGLIIENPADAEGLAAQMELMLDASLRERMGAAARRLALEHTLERNCEEILAIYRQIERSKSAMDRNNTISILK